MGNMRKLFILFLLAVTQTVCAQTITGVVVDEETGDSIPNPTVQYKGDDFAAQSDVSGRFSIVRRNGKYLTFSAVGYKTLRILIGANTPGEMRITLKPDTRRLKGEGWTDERQDESLPDAVITELSQLLR